MPKLFSFFPCKSSTKQRPKRDRKKADWPLLPTNLVNDVAALLSAADQARMASTCKPWKQAMEDGFRRTPPKPSIWVLLADGTDDVTQTRCEFQSFSETLERSYFFSVPFAGARVLPSSRGWIMLEDDAARLHAVNPITNATLSFPAAGCPRRRPSDVICKAVVVKRKGLPVMAAIMRGDVDYRRSSAEVAVAEPGNATWTTLAAPPYSLFTDIAAHDGKLYALDGENQILVYDLRKKKPEPLHLAAKIEVKRNNRHYQSFLGIISGAVVVVFWLCPHCTVAWRKRLPEIEVYTLDPAAKDGWAAMKSLHGHAVLIGHDGILVLPAGEFEELAADCFYSLQSQEFDSNARLTVVDFGTKDVSFRRLDVDQSRLPVWFLPERDDA